MLLNPTYAWSVSFQISLLAGNRTNKFKKHSIAICLILFEKYDLRLMKWKKVPQPSTFNLNLQPQTQPSFIVKKKEVDYMDVCWKAQEIHAHGDHKGIWKSRQEKRSTELVRWSSKQYTLWILKYFLYIHILSNETTEAPGWTWAMAQQVRAQQEPNTQGLENCSVWFTHKGAVSSLGFAV